MTFDVSHYWKWDDDWVVKHVSLSCNSKPDTYSSIYLNQSNQCRSKAHIPPETALALATQNTNEMDTNKIKSTLPTLGPNTRGPKATYIPPARIGLALGL